MPVQVARKCQEMSSSGRYQVTGAARRVQVPCGRRGQVPGSARYQGLKDGRCQGLGGASPKTPEAPRVLPVRQECHQLLDSRRKGPGHQSQGTSRASRRPHYIQLLVSFFLQWNLVHQFILVF